MTKCKLITYVSPYCEELGDYIFQLKDIGIWEDLTDEEIVKVRTAIQYENETLNPYHNSTRIQTCLVIDSPMSPKALIAKYVETVEKEKVKKAEEKKKREEAAKKSEAAKAAKALEKKRKQLEKLKAELGENG